MSNATTFAPAPVATNRKVNARVALFDLPGTATNLLTDCFHQFGIETVAVSASAAERLTREKVDACVVPISLDVAPIIELARASASNSRMVIFGLGGTALESMRYSKYCINAVFQEPLERSAALKLVRSTRALVLHEFRRYVRVPVMTEVAVVTGDGGRVMVTSQELSAGGMSVKGTATLEPGQMVEVSFALLTLPRIWVRGSVAWKKPDKTMGLRFDPTDERRQRLKQWIVSYLDS
jgi:PilZ domain